MTKADAKRIAHLCAYGAIRNFIDSGGWMRWSEKDSAKVCGELEKLAKHHDDRVFGATIPSEGSVETRNAQSNVREG